MWNEKYEAYQVIALCLVYMEFFLCFLWIYLYKSTLEPHFSHCAARWLGGASEINDPGFMFNLFES